MADLLVSVVLVDGPLGPATTTPVPGAGAWIVFEGIVRSTEDDVPISALDYEVYEPMAQRQLERLANEVGRAHAVMGMVVEHSRAVVPVGACSFRLSVGAKHRAPALAAMGEFIDRMKQDVPIWKRALPADR